MKAGVAYPELFGGCGIHGFHGTTTCGAKYCLLLSQFVFVLCVTVPVHSLPSYQASWRTYAKNRVRPKSPLRPGMPRP
jgi:hypothetical protein